MDKQCLSCPYPSTFSKSKDNVLLDMSTETPNQLNIHLHYLQNTKQYHLTVTEETIRGDSNIDKYFGSIYDLYDQLIQNFNDLTMIPEGQISFDIKIGKTKKKNVELVCKVVEIDPNKDIKYLKDEIKRLQTNQHELRQKMKELQQQTQDLKLTVNSQSNQIQDLNEKVERLTELVENIQQKKMEKKNHLISLSKAKKETIKTSFEKESYYTAITQFWPHPGHPNNCFFKVCDQHTVLTRIQENSRSELFILNANLKDDEAYTITIEIRKTRKGFINISVLSEDVFTKYNAIKFDENITYDIQSEEIWAGGKLIEVAKRQSLAIGEAIKLVVDRLKNIVEWYSVHQDGRVLLIGQAQIPVLLQDEKYLYPAICMFHQGDSVRVIE